MEQPRVTGGRRRNEARAAGQVERDRNHRAELEAKRVGQFVLRIDQGDITAGLELIGYFAHHWE